ncbi:MAG: urease accessory protein UreD [Nostocaceae cyanobacterium]|nr:urease accessory protein UreD [Nostocaceae cyanobacterium]
MSNSIDTKKSSVWHGKLDLKYAHNQDKTQLIHSYQQAPLKIQRPFYPEGNKVCHSVILHTAGGIVGGDQLSTNFHLEPHAQALITTAAASKIYKSNGLQSRQNINIQVDTGACLEYLPQETIVFDGGIYRQDLRIQLATNSSYLGWEITRFGRSARGEKFFQGEWRSNTEIWREEKPLWIDRQWLPGREDVFHSPHGLGGQPVVGSLVYVGETVSPEIVTKARCLFTSSSEIGVTRLEYGFLCRYRGCDTTEVRNWFIGVWELLRICFLNRGKCIPRVWQI